MPDAWEILQSKSSGTGDAWDLLTNITGGGAYPGEPIKELVFDFSQQALAGSILVPVLSGAVGSVVSGVMETAAMGGSAKVAATAGTIAVEDI